MKHNPPEACSIFIATITRSCLLHRSRQILTFTILLLITFSIRTIYTAEDIELPDIVIFGEAEKLPDTISLDKLLQEYWALSDLSKFRYRPFISFEPAKTHTGRQHDHSVGFVALDMGTDFDSLFLIGLKASYSDPENIFHHYKSSLYSNSFSSKRSRFNYHLSWQPQVFKSFTDDERLHSSKTEVSFAFNSFREKDRIVNKFDNYTTGLFLELGQTEIFDEFAVKLSHSYTDQTIKPSNNNGERSYPTVQEINNDISDIDFTVQTVIPLAQNTEWQGKLPIIVSSIRSRQVISSAYKVDSFYGLNDIGLYLVVDEESVLPSIPFLFVHELNRYSSLHLHNIPFFNEKSRYDILKDNPDQEIIFDQPLTKTPLNLSLKLTNNKFIPLSLNYNVRWNKDYIYYDSSRIGLFDMHSCDLTEHIFGLSTAYHWSNVSLGHSSNYFITNRPIPFKQEWEHKMKVSWMLHNTNLAKELVYLDGRKDSEEEVIDSSLILNLRADHRLRDDLALNFALENVLASDYRDYLLPESQGKQIPSDGFKLRAGLTWTF